MTFALIIEFLKLKGGNMKPITTIVGRLGKKNTVNVGEHTVTNFSVAVNELIRNEDGSYDKKTHWYNIEAWNAKAKVIENHVSIGQFVAITATIENNLSSSDPKYVGQIKFVADGISYNPSRDGVENTDKKPMFTTDEIPFN